MLKKFFLTKLTSFKQSSFVKSLLFILPLFFLSRAILLLIAWFSQYFVASSYPDANLLEKGWLFHPQYYLDVWGRWDSGWYMRIVQEGYQLKGTWAFFPLYPLLINALAFLLPIAKTAGVFFIIGLIISNFSAILALALFHQLTFIISKNKKVAQLSIYYLLTFPTAFVLSSFYTESLFLLISFGFFIALEKKHYYLGALLGGVGAIARSPGLLLFIPLIYQLGQDFFAKSFNTDGSNIKQASNNQFKKLIKVGLSSLIIFFTPLALWLYTAWQKTGNIFTPFSSQGLWQKKFTWIFQTIFQPLNFVGFVSPTEKYLAIISLIVLVMGFTLSKNKKYFWYSLAMLALPLSSGTLASFARYLLVIFPLFIFLAQLSQEKKILSQAIIAFFISLQVMFFIAWCRFYWII